MWNAECEMRNGCATVDSAFRTPHSALASVLNVALTGNIAAGKSTVVDLFRRWGATIIDADVLVREAQAPGGEVLAAIAGRFGADVLASDGTLDRAALRGKVMGDQAALDALNQIVHPAVRRRREELLREAREGGDLLVVNDIPLLFEALDPGEAREQPALNPIAARYADAGLAVRRVTGDAAAIEKARGQPAAPDAIVATAAAAAAAEQAWADAGRPGVLTSLSEDPDPVAVRLDLRPWGAGRGLLGEPGAAGPAPRAHLVDRKSGVEGKRGDLGGRR